MLHGSWKQIGVIVVLAAMPLILLSLLFVGVLFGAIFSSLSLPR